MKFIVISIVAIIMFWFIQGTIFTYMSNDPALFETYSVDGNFSFTDSSFNRTGIYNATTGYDSFDGQTFFETFLQLFTFKIPPYVLPAPFSYFLNFLNWFMLTYLLIIIALAVGNVAMKILGFFV